MTSNVLKILYQNLGESVSGQQIADTLGVSRAAVKKHIDKLIILGYNITAIKKSGYKLEYFDDVFEENAVKMFFDIYGINVDIIFFNQTDSTNVQAKKLFFKSNEGVVIAKKQTDGKGRRGRNFASEDGGVYLTYYCRPQNISPFDTVKSVICAAVAVYNTLNRFGAVCGIKWTNDIFSGGKKICGILCEMLCESERVEYLLQGAGININNEFLSGDLKDIAVSLRQVTGKKFNRAEICAKLVKELICCNKMLFEGNFDSILKIYKDNCFTLNKEVYISGEKSYSAKAVDIDENGFLIVNADSKIIKLTYGDVSVKV